MVDRPMNAIAPRCPSRGHLNELQPQSSFIQQSNGFSTAKEILGEMSYRGEPLDIFFDFCK
jgi:hypothetical protein